MLSPEDESLHSFIFRQQYIQGYNFSPKGVIQRNGLWRAQPYVHHEALDIFNNIDDFKLLNLRNTFHVSTGEGFQLFDNYFSYDKDLRAIFRSGKHQFYGLSHNGIRIKFCPICISEMLYEIGYSYLKKDWYNSNRCNVHQTALKWIRPISYEKSVKILIDVLHGKKIKKSEISYTNIRSNKINDENFDLSLYPARVLGCDEKVIVKYILENIKKLKDMPLQISYHELTLWLEEWSLDNSHQKSQKIFYELFVLIQEVMPLAEFVDDNFDYLEISLGQKKQLSEILMVSKKRNCKLGVNCNCNSLLKESKIMKNPNLISFFERSSLLKSLSINSGQLIPLTECSWGPITLKRF